MFNGPSRDRSWHFVPEAKMKSYSEEALQCPHCEESVYFKKEHDLVTHRKKKHLELLLSKGEAISNTCLMCPYKADSLEALRMHVKSEHLLTSPTSSRVQRELFVCDVCERMFLNKMLLAMHFNRRHSGLPKSQAFNCLLCHRRLKRTSIFLHNRQHRIKNTTTCPICVKVYLSKIRLKEHMKSHLKYYFCNMCGYDPTTESLANKHIQTHKSERKIIGAPINEEPSATDKCLIRKFFVNPNNLKATEGRFNDGGFNLPSPFNICVLCQEICYTEQEMYLHVKHDHAERKMSPVMKQKYLCSCGKIFDLKVLIKHHMFKSGCGSLGVKGGE